ncbi:MAG: polysaccharide pyruvyl transferase family protein [Anaerolineae bacterium]|nr:polysaccharide pyruvyl transferase family protein [Anaerolineae bacterium]
MSHSGTVIAIKGSYGVGNFGDDALMVAAHEISKRTFDSELHLFIGRNSDYVQNIIPGARIISQESKKARNADLIVFGGGTQFYSFPQTSRQGIGRLYSRIARNIRTPAALGKRVFRKMIGASFPASESSVAAIGIGLGPFVENNAYVRKVRELFTRMEYIAVRDRCSYDLCKQWGLSNVSLRADLCYLPGLWKSDVFELSADSAKEGIQKIGVIPRDWPHTAEGNSYTTPLFQVVHALKTAGKQVEFISFAGKSDSRWAGWLQDRNEKLEVWNPEKCTITGFMELLSGYDAFITARYHGAVFASILRKPMVCIEVEQKLRLVSDLLGAGARLWTYPFNTSECLEHISALEDDYSSAEQCLARVVGEQGVLVGKMIDEFRKVMNSKIDRLH